MSNSFDGSGPRRPLLGYGERLREDADRARSGAPKFHPFSALEAWERLQPQAQNMLDTLESIPSGAVGHHVVFEATLQPNYLASSWFPSRVIDSGELYVVGSRAVTADKITEKSIKKDQRTRRLLLAGAPEAVRNFATRVASPPSDTSQSEWDEIRRFADIGIPEPSQIVVGHPDGRVSEAVWEAVITHVYDSPEHEHVWADEHFQRFVDWVSRSGGRVDVERRRDLRGLTFVPVVLSPSEVEQVASFNLLRAIRPMPTIGPFPTSIVRAFGGQVRVSEAAINGVLPDTTIAVFDGGVDSTLSAFDPFVSTVDLTPEPETAWATQHGSLVTSALLYGPVDPSEQLPDPAACVDHYRVLPVPADGSVIPGAEVYWMLDRMVETLRARPYSIVACAFGPNESVDDSAEPTRFTTELDALAQEFGITFVVAVGNNGQDDPVLGFNRVQPPGDMVNGIGVGACTEPDTTTKTRRAPYSAVGPGREGQRVQPTVVEFGGSPASPFIGFDDRGRIAQALGTSFAAPSAARTVAELQSTLPSHLCRPEVSRAFAAHFAKRWYGHGKRYLELGYGRLPASFQKAFECEPNEVAVVYDDELVRGQAVALRFPFPDGIDPTVKLRFEWTLCFTSEVDPRDAADYTVSGIEAVFRPDDRLRSLTDPETRRSERVRLDVDGEKVRTALVAGHTLSQEPKAHSGWSSTRSEQRLRRDGKWETLIRGRYQADASDLAAPRLDVTHLRREAGRLVYGDQIPPLKFVLLLTIRAPLGVVLYDRVASQFRVLRPLVRLPLSISGVA